MAETTAAENSVFVATRITVDEREALAQTARRNERSLSAELRLALRAYLEATKED